MRPLPNLWAKMDEKFHCNNYYRWMQIKMFQIESETQFTDCHSLSTALWCSADVIPCHRTMPCSRSNWWFGPCTCTERLISNRAFCRSRGAAGRLRRGRRGRHRWPFSSAAPRSPRRSSAVSCRLVGHRSCRCTCNAAHSPLTNDPLLCAGISACCSSPICVCRRFRFEAGFGTTIPVSTVPGLQGSAEWMGRAGSFEFRVCTCNGEGNVSSFLDAKSYGEHAKESHAEHEKMRKSSLFLNTYSSRSRGAAWIIR